MMDDQPPVNAAIRAIAPRLRRARERKSVTLAELARTTGISTSTLSRLESGQRRPSLELLLPIIAALGLRLDDIVSAPRLVNPPLPDRSEGRILVPLSRQRTGLQAVIEIIPAETGERQQQVHHGHLWLYVLRGKLRLLLGDHELVLSPGEAAEFDCQTPHWFGSANRNSVEVISLYGKQGERIRLRARSRPGTS